MTGENLSKIKEGLLIVPAVHFLICIIYLDFYYRSFGNAVQTFASPTDVFSVSLAQIAPTYLSFAIGGALGLAPRAFGSRVPSAPLKEPTTAVRILVWVTVFMAVLSLISFYLYHWLTSYYQYFYLLSIPVLLLILYLYLPELTRRHWSTANLAFYIGTAVLLIVCINGLSRGQADRMISYDDAAKDHPRCGEYVVVAPLGERFLAIASDQSRVVINEDCEVKIVLVAAQAFRPPPPPLIEALANRMRR